MLNQRLRLLIAAVLVATPLLWWGLVSPDRTSAPAPAADRERVDFFIRGAEVTRWQADGSVAQILTTPLLQHYPARAAMELDTPQLHMPGADRGHYLLRAERGTMPDARNRILLAGDVQLHDNPAADVPGRLYTDRLTLYPPRDYGHTDQPVRIERGADITTAVGMELFFDQQRIELLSDVKGEYHAQ